jgi:hypothetical protein
MALTLSENAFTYLFGIRGNIVPYNFEFRDCRRMVLEIFESKEISREGVCQRVINENVNSYLADSRVDDATISFPFAFRAADMAIEVGPSAGTSNEGFRIVRPALVVR